MGRTWAVWDVETLRLAHEVPGGWANPAGFGLAVAKVLDERGTLHTFYEGDALALLRLLAEKDLVVGFNSLKFDCGVLAAHGDVTPICRRTLDLLASLDACTRIPHCVSLERVCRATLGVGKLLAGGAEAVRLWRQGGAEGRRLVEAYCEEDVRLTFHLWQFGAERGYVLVPLRAHGGRPAHPAARVPVRWPAP